MKSLALVLAMVALSAVAVPAPQRPIDQGQPVSASAVCRDGKLVAIKIEAPFAGVVTVPILPDICAEPEKPKPPPRVPARTT